MGSMGFPFGGGSSSLTAGLRRYPLALHFRGRIMLALVHIILAIGIFG